MYKLKCIFVLQDRLENYGCKNEVLGMKKLFLKGRTRHEIHYLRMNTTEKIKWFNFLLVQLKYCKWHSTLKNVTAEEIWFI